MHMWKILSGRNTVSARTVCLQEAKSWADSQPLLQTALVPQILWKNVRTPLRKAWWYYAQALRQRLLHAEPVIDGKAKDIESSRRCERGKEIQENKKVKSIARRRNRDVANYHYLPWYNDFSQYLKLRRTKKAFSKKERQKNVEEAQKEICKKISIQVEKQTASSPSINSYTSIIGQLWLFKRVMFLAEPRLRLP